MPYDYAKERDIVFTDSGQRMLLDIHRRAKNLIDVSGSVRLDKIIERMCGDTWQMIACIDRLVELGVLRERQQSGNIWGQDRIFY